VLTKQAYVISQEQSATQNLTVPFSYYNINLWIDTCTFKNLKIDKPVFSELFTTKISNCIRQDNLFELDISG